ncbi:MAG: hypothetical protein JWQ35_526 [Bacteriovoracaceae bacterium]|nr:hypothetical protein [Bacteriovoracaceae bacterium]
MVTEEKKEPPVKGALNLLCNEIFYFFIDFENVSPDSQGCSNCSSESSLKHLEDSLTVHAVSRLNI